MDEREEMEKIENREKNILKNSKESTKNSHDPVPLTRAIFLALISKNPNITGYELMSLVPKIMNDRIKFKSGTLYSELRRLESMGYVSSEQSTTGRKQRKYKITMAGKETLKRISKQIKDRIQYILNPLISLIDSLDF
ncbi:MAG: PadR family transcriptional regulator [Promethearchaeota archaeon]